MLRLKESKIPEIWPLGGRYMQLDVHYVLSIFTIIYW